MVVVVVAQLVDSLYMLLLLLLTSRISCRHLGCYSLSYCLVELVLLLLLLLLRCKIFTLPPTRKLVLQKITPAATTVIFKLPFFPKLNFVAGVEKLKIAAHTCLLLFRFSQLTSSYDFKTNWILSTKTKQRLKRTHIFHQILKMQW